MIVNALIFDLDNTLFDAKTIGHELFHPIFDLVEKEGNLGDHLNDFKTDMMRIPFQKVASNYNLSDRLQEQCTAILKGLTYNGNASTFPDYRLIKNLKQDKFIVTAGFHKLQMSKIEALDLCNDFKDIIVVDASTSNATKKSTFQDIILKYGYHEKEVMIIGDDPDSEITAALEIGAIPVLYNPHQQYDADGDIIKISNYSELIPLLEN